LANSIVFQNSAEQLKTAIYGYDGTSFAPIKVDASGALDIVVGTITSIASGTVKVASITNGTVKVASGTVTVASITNGTVKSTVTSITNGTVKATVTSITNGTVKATVASITNGTVKSTVTSITNGTIKLASTSATVKINIVDRTFTSTTQTIRVAAISSTFSNLVDISKYQETSWYIKNVTKSSIVTIQLAVTPSNARSTYPLALIQETATVRNNTTAITNSYYMKYATAKISNILGLAQTIVVVFNGRY
jgi:hypothetical protein